MVLFFFFLFLLFFNHLFKPFSRVNHSKILCINCVIMYMVKVYKCISSL